jgi:hypothetical protein
MTDEQGANEIKYRVASLLLLSLLDRGLITLLDCTASISAQSVFELYHTLC